MYLSSPLPQDFLKSTIINSIRILHRSFAPNLESRNWPLHRLQWSFFSWHPAHIFSDKWGMETHRGTTLQDGFQPSPWPTMTGLGSTSDREDGVPERSHFFPAVVYWCSKNPVCCCRDVETCGILGFYSLRPKISQSATLTVHAQATASFLRILQWAHHKLRPSTFK